MLFFFRCFAGSWTFFAKTCFVQLFDVDETHVERCMHTQYLFFLLSATPAAVHAGDCVLP